MKIGVVVAHPDDEVLGCGGTLAGLSGSHAAHILVLGEGIRARDPSGAAGSDRLIRRLQEQSRKVAALLGAKTIEFAGLPDNQFDARPLLDVIRIVERWMVERRVEAIYTHHPGDLNIDHQIAFRAVLTATRPMRGCLVRDLYACEIPSSTEWAFQRLEPAFCPNVFVDISSTLRTKLHAMRLYADELRPFPHPRSLKALRAVAQRWGSVAGLAYAEPFELIRSVR